MLGVMAAAALEAAINQSLALVLSQYQDEDAQEKLKALNGKVIAIDLQGIKCSFYLIFNNDTIHVQSQLQGKADTRITGTPLSLLRMKLEGRQHMLFSGDVSISGDSEVGQQMYALLNELGIDWEEHLSHFIGDVLAHELGSRARELNDWARQACTTLAQDSSEYLHEEVQILVSRNDLEPFLAAVDILRDDTARLKKRYERLRREIQYKNQKDENKGQTE